LSSFVIVGSLLAGASIVHNIYKPDMVSCWCLSCPLIVNLSCTQHTSFSAKFLDENLLIFCFISAPVDYSTR
jgi:hypothetical protein